MVEEPLLVYCSQCSVSWGGRGASFWVVVLMAFDIAEGGRKRFQLVGHTCYHVVDVVVICNSVVREGDCSSYVVFDVLYHTFTVAVDCDGCRVGWYRAGKHRIVVVKEQQGCQNAECFQSPRLGIIH